MSKKFIDYVGLFKYAATISTILFVGTIVMYFTKGINYGVDFRGGVEIQTKLHKDVDLGELRELMESNKVPLSQLQSIGTASQNEFLLKLDLNEGDLNAVSSQVEKVLNDKFGDENVDILKNDIVGPKAGEELRVSAFKAISW